MSAVTLYMRSLPVCEFDVPVGIVRLLYTGVNFRAVQQSAELIQFSDIDKFPLHQLLFMVVKAVLFSFANRHCLEERFFFVHGIDKPELLVKLWGMISIPTDDPVNDL